jgi:hydrogenase expression/formation protein HypC
MCLAIPGQVVEIYERDAMSFGRVDFGGIEKEVSLVYLPEIVVGDYAIVHVGFAIGRLDEESARRSLELFERIGVLEEELGDGSGT